MRICDDRHPGVGGIWFSTIFLKNPVMRPFRKTQLKRTKNAGFGKGPFCKAHAGAESFLRRRSGIVTQKRPSWCIDRDHKKEVVSVRVMRKTFTPFGHFFEEKIKWHLH